MQIGKEVREAINTQAGLELGNSQFYLGLSFWSHNAGYPGIANWFLVQSEEERKHAMKFFHHIQERFGVCSVPDLPAPKISVADPLDAFKQALKAEKDNSVLLIKLYKTLKDNNDYVSESMMHWFLNEQIEEENSADAIVTRLEHAGSQIGVALMMLDHELAQRK
jgi:ferritin